MTKFSIATNRTWKGKDGSKQTSTDYHNIVFWGKAAETICQYVEQGSLLFVAGRLQTTKWEDKKGVAHYSTEIIGEDFQFGPKAAGNGNTKPAQERDVQIGEDPFAEKKDEKMTDDIPF